MQIPAILYRLAVACWVGGATLFTFVLTPAIFKSYSRDMAGGIVGVLFPGYFKWGLACGVIALAALFFSAARHRTAAAIIIAAMLAITAVQAFVIEPRAAALKKEIPGIEKEIENGDFGKISEWLREKIHKHGRKFTTDEIIKKICNEGINLDFYLDYLRKKYSEIYNL